MRAPLRAAISATLLTLACGPTSAAPPAPQGNTSAQRLRGYIECWRLFNDKLWDQFQNCYSENATSETVDAGPPLRGRAAIIDADKKYAESFPNRRGELKIVLADGPHALGIVLWTGTNDGPLVVPGGKTLPATHKSIGFVVAQVIEFDAQGARAERESFYTDQATMMVQLGLSKAPARPVVAPTDTAPIEVLGNHDEIEKKNLQVVKTAIEAVNRNDLKAFNDLLADNYTASDATMAVDQNRKEEIAVLENYRKAFSDMSLNVSTSWAAGDWVVISGTFTGTNDGAAPTLGIPAKTGRKVSVRFLEIFKLVLGKITIDGTFYNGAAFAAQLGLK